MTTGPTHGARAHDPAGHATDPTEPTDPTRVRTDPGTAGVAPPAPGRRRPRRAVRPGTGDPDPSVGLRAVDDLDIGWQAAVSSSPGDADDDRLRREVPPHW